MRMFIFVLAIGIVSVYNVAGLVGVIALLLGLAVIFGVAAFAWRMVTVAESGGDIEMPFASTVGTCWVPRIGEGEVGDLVWPEHFWPECTTEFCGEPPGFGDERCDDLDNDCNQPLFLALLALLDPCTTADGAIQYSVCMAPVGACTTTGCDDNCPDTPNDDQLDSDGGPSKVAIRRGRMSHMGNEERRASRLKPDNSWKRHRSTQWK